MVRVRIQSQWGNQKLADSCTKTGPMSETSRWWCQVVYAATRPLPIHGKDITRPPWPQKAVWRGREALQHDSWPSREWVWPPSVLVHCEIFLIFSNYFLSAMSIKENRNVFGRGWSPPPTLGGGGRNLWDRFRSENSVGFFQSMIFP